MSTISRFWWTPPGLIFLLSFSKSQIPPNVPKVCSVHTYESPKHTGTFFRAVKGSPGSILCVYFAFSDVLPCFLSNLDTQKYMQCILSVYSTHRTFSVYAHILLRDPSFVNILEIGLIMRELINIRPLSIQNYVIKDQALNIYELKSLFINLLTCQIQVEGLCFKIYIYMVIEYQHLKSQLTLTQVKLRLNI